MVGISWNKGTHIKTNNALENWRKNGGHNNTEIKKGQHLSEKTEYKKGRKHAEEWKRNMSKIMKGRKFTEEWRKKIGKGNTKLGLSKTKEYARFHRIKRRKFLKNNGGNITVKIIQVIYEDNIKKYGTLTCYLCEKSIPFGKDHLEHKTPVSRGGTNDRKNLAVSCRECNFRKHTKTEAEYRKEGVLFL